jgi:PhnB protein
MSVTTTPHLNFRGDARAALEFWHSVFGGQLSVVSYADAQAVTDESEAQQVIYGQLLSEEGLRVMAFDVPSARPYDAGVVPVFVSVRGTDADELTRYWEALVEGGTIVTPLGQSMWSPLYGMVADRFGVTWVLDLEVPWDGSAS